MSSTAPKPGLPPTPGPARDAPQRPIVVPPTEGGPRRTLTRPAVAALVAVGVALGLIVSEAIDARPAAEASVAEAVIETVSVARKRFESTYRTGGTVGATSLAMIRAPRMRGGRDRGGGGSLTIQFLAEPGSIVQEGDVVAVFETRRTADMLDNYESQLAQTRRRSASRKANLLISAETLRQSHLKARADAQKAGLELRTAEVKSEIQAEILKLLAEQHGATARQLEQEVRFAKVADKAEVRSLEIDVQKDENRLGRTKSDLSKMEMRTPVSGLVVVETTFNRDSFAQAAAGDQVNPGAYFLRVVDLSKMAVFADVNQADTQSIRVGASVRVALDAYPGAVFEGRVASIGAMAVSGNSSGGGGRGMRGSRGGSSGQWVRKVPVQIDIVSDDDRIMPDLSASADIMVQVQDEAVVVPRSALGRSGNRTVVWVEEDEGFAVRPVEIGPLSDTEAVVLSGLAEGETIAVQKLADEDSSEDPEMS